VIVKIIKKKMVKNIRWTTTILVH